MKNLGKYSNDKLKAKIDKCEYKIDQYASLFWAAVGIGIILVATLCYGLLFKIAWLAKTCAIVAGLQAANMCLFFFFSMKKFDKIEKLKQELEKRERLTEKYTTLEKAQNIELETSKQNAKNSTKDNNKDVNKDDDLNHGL